MRRSWCKAIRPTACSTRGSLRSHRSGYRHAYSSHIARVVTIDLPHVVLLYCVFPVMVRSSNAQERLQARVQENGAREISRRETRAAETAELALISSLEKQLEVAYSRNSQQAADAEKQAVQLRADMQRSSEAMLLARREKVREHSSAVKRCAVDPTLPSPCHATVL